MSRRVSSPKKIQHLRISPEHIEFLYDSMGISQAKNSLINCTRNWVAFKIKTNEPNLYIVQPNQGKIPPSESISILISVDWGEVKVLIKNNI